MSDQSLQTVQPNNIPQTNPPAMEQLPPPSGDLEKADKYIHALIDLITADKLLVAHTDLSKFDPTSLQDHYRLDLKDYEIEISHNKHPDKGQDSFVILFNNLKHLNEQSSSKVILAYIHLNEIQFKKFKTISDDQIFRKKKAAEEKRFKEALVPIDQILEQLNSSDALEENETEAEDIENSGNHDQPTINTSQATTLDETPPAFVASA